MRPNVRFLLPLIAGLVVLSVSFAMYQASAERRGLERELDRRAETMADGLMEPVDGALARGSVADLQRLAQRFNVDGRVLGVAIYDKMGAPVAVSARLERFAKTIDAFALAPEHGSGIGKVIREGSTSLHVFALRLQQDQRLLGIMALVHDASEIDRQGARVFSTRSVTRFSNSARVKVRR